MLDGWEAGDVVQVEEGEDGVVMGHGGSQLRHSTKVAGCQSPGSLLPPVSVLTLTLHPVHPLLHLISLGLDQTAVTSQHYLQQADPGSGHNSGVFPSAFFLIVIVQTELGV